MGVAPSNRTPQSRTTKDISPPPLSKFSSNASVTSLHLRGADSPRQQRGASWRFARCSRPAGMIAWGWAFPPTQPPGAHPRTAVDGSVGWRRSVVCPQLTAVRFPYLPPTDRRRREQPTTRHGAYDEEERSRRNNTNARRTQHYQQQQGSRQPMAAEERQWQYLTPAGDKRVRLCGWVDMGFGRRLLHIRSPASPVLLGEYHTHAATPPYMYVYINPQGPFPESTLMRMLVKRLPGLDSSSYCWYVGRQVVPRVRAWMYICSRPACTHESPRTCTRSQPNPTHPIRRHRHRNQDARDGAVAARGPLAALSRPAHRTGTLVNYS